MTEHFFNTHNVCPHSTTLEQRPGFGLEVAIRTPLSEIVQKLLHITHNKAYYFYSLSLKQIKGAIDANVKDDDFTLI